MAIPIINLSILNGSNGFRMDGLTADNASHGSISNAGDVNGDGFDDVIVGAYKADPNGRYSGSSYVVFGKAAGFDAATDLSGLDGTNGFRLNGEKSSSSGFSVSNAGDVNGDGFDDVIIGAFNEGYVVFGKASGFDAAMELSGLDGNDGFRLNGTAVEGFSRGLVSTAGDVNGDGFDDLIVGASNANLNGTQSGASFVIFGKASDFNAVVDLSNLDGNNGFRLGGEAYDNVGTSVSDAGDVNGDGFDDLIVGATYADGNGNGGGTSYVVFGRTSGFDAAMSLADLDGGDGFRLDGVAEGDRSGLSVSTAGDVNGDGFDDLIVGAPNVGRSNGYTDYGASYVVFGKASGFDAAINLSGLNGNNGFRLDGVTEDDRSGVSVSNAGDVNGDGFDDLIIGAADADPNASSYFSAPGASYVMFGKASGFAAAINLSSLNGSNGFRLDGVAAGDHSGKSVSTAGDVNADGFDDLIVGAVGAGYVIFGGDFIAGEAVYLGTSGDDTLTGTATGERFEAGDGNDILLGRGGADVFQGDAGDDIIKVPDLEFQSLDGGTGADILELTGLNNLDLDLADFKGRITGIETIDLTGLKDYAGNQLSMNSLTFTLADLLSLSETTPVFTVNGNTNDKVVGLADDGWTDEGMDGNYHIYTNAGTTLRVDSDVNTDLPTRGVLSLANINGDNGFRLDGVVLGGNSGISVSNAGDVNGDGFDDVIVGAPRAKLNGEYSGASYVVFGKASAFDAAMNLADLDGNDGFQLGGVYTYAAVSSVGDVNGDGFDDVSIGVHDGGYVVFGKASGFDAAMNLSGIDGNNGFHLQGADPHFVSFGAVISGAGDINGDGFDDVIVGSPSAGRRYSTDDNYYSYGYGASYVVFGKATGFSDVMDLASLDGTNGFRLDGASKRGYVGASVSSAGDVNGDGFDDAIMGTSGGGYIVFGKAAGFDAAMNLSAIDGNNGFRLDGAVTHSPFAMSAIVNAAGDVNGDGFDDVIIGASDADPNGENSGSSYVVFGKASGFDAAINLSDLDGSNGFRLDGMARDALSGKSVSTAGDVNGDGFDDLIVGAPGSLYGNSASHVVFGKASGFDAVINLSSIVDNNGFRLEGVSGEGAGTSVSTAGDFNNDGFDDLIVGAPFADPNGSRSSAGYVIFGKKNFAGEAILSGTTGDDVLTGTTTAERFEAGSGNDIMIGHGGRDVFQGEDGDDIIQVPDLDFQSLDGGAGTDILELSGINFFNLDLADFRDAIDGIETISLENSFRSTLTLTLPDLLSLSDTTHTFTVEGNSTTNIIGLVNGWTDAGMDGNYHIYTNSGTVLRVDSEVVTDVPLRGVISLADLNGNNGFRLDGVARGDNSGYSVSNAGDVNGDGFDDVIVGAYRADPNGRESGSSYVVFGKAAGFDATMNLASLDGKNGFRLDGVANNDRLGQAVSNAGDVNGDGFDDLIVAAPRANTNGNFSGASYVVFGKASGFNAAMGLSDLDGSNGFRLDGAKYDSSGSSVSSAGDVNGDGFDDLIVGAKYAGSNGNLSGISYVVFGKASGFDAAMDLSNLDGSNGFSLDGVAKDDNAGSSVSSAGDVNGDGFDDLIVGALGADPNGDQSGSSYVVFGRSSGFDAAINLSGLNGSNGFRMDGASSHSLAGSSVSNAGDVNGDGFDDLIVGAPGTSSSGSSYVVFGKASGFGATLELSSLDGSNGFQLSGRTDESYSGSSVSTAGDINGDGYADLLVGVYKALPNSNLYAGASYVVFGKASEFDAVMNLSGMVDNNGLRIEGVSSYDFSGKSVSSAGDVNGDGFDDLMIGAPRVDSNGDESGSSYIIFGRSDFGGTGVTHPGTPGNDNLIGTSEADIFDAGDGNDNLIGRGGADVFHAGTGDDNIRVSDLNFQLIEGGTGNDVLHLTGKDLNLDLSSLGDKISGIETICLFGNGDNALTVTAAGLMNLSESTNTLKVNGNAGDHIIGLSSGWTDEGARGGGYFHAYTQGDAVLLVGANVTTDFAVI